MKSGSAALGMVGNEPTIKAMWFRGGWFDSLSVLWRDWNGQVHPERWQSRRHGRGRNGGSILINGRLEAGEKSPTLL